MTAPFSVVSKAFSLPKLKTFMFPMLLKVIQFICPGEIMSNPAAEFSPGKIGLSELQRKQKQDS